MKKSLSFLLVFFASQLFAVNGFAQAVSLADANKLFDFVEVFYPELASPPADTQQLNAVGSDWFVRVFSDSGIILAVNINGTGPFFADEVYALGGPFGDEPFFAGTLADLIVFIDSLIGDDDGDGVISSEDQCAGTPSGEPVNAQGCSDSQLDDDGDGVSNALDQCPSTPTGEAVNGAGCSDTELDDDNDGVSNATDQCPATPAGEPVTTEGCSAVQLGIIVTQADADKLFNFTEALDASAFSPPALTQTVTQQSSEWYVRTYTNTGIAIKISINGTGEFFAGNVYVVGGPFGDDELFIDTLANLVAYINSLPVLDDDNDGVANDTDQCPSTPTGEAVNGVGCSDTELDDDFDGVNNALDQCSDTPDGEPADARGCSASQLDDDDIPLVECPSSPNTPTDICETMVAGEALVLPIEGAVFSIPADALAPGTAIRLTIVDEATLDGPPNGSGEAVITPIYELTFSNTQRASEDVLFSFDIPAELPYENLYARLLIEGGIISEGIVDSDWSIEFDKIASPTDQLSIELSATARRIMIVGINPETVVQSRAQVAFLSDANNISEAKVSALEIAVGIGETYRPALADHGWMILCDPSEFEKASNDACDPSHPEFNSMMNTLGENVYNSDKMLTALGFPMAETKIATRGGSIPQIIYDPDGRSLTNSVTYIEPGNVFTTMKIYHVAWVVPPVGSNAGWYETGTKRLAVKALKGDDVVIHELMHAVQNYEVPNIWNVSNGQWISEGLADAVIPFSETDTFPSPEEYRTYGYWRNWSNILSSSEGQEEYETSEFWLSTLSSNLSPLPDFYKNFSTTGPFSDASGYAAVDQAMKESGLPALSDAYKALILKRNNDPRYPHCESVTPSCSGGSCEIITSISAISASCYDVNVSFDNCSNEDPDIVATLETGSASEPNPNIEMMINGSLYAADAEVDFSGQGRIWAINTAYADGGEAEVATIKFEDKTNCYVQLERQKIFASAAADASAGGGNALSPGTDGSSDTYTSYENLIPNSFITSYERLRNPDQFINTVVAPLGLNAWIASPSVSTMHRCDDVMFPGCTNNTVSTATASATVTTDTDKDATTMTTVGSHALSAAIGNKAPVAASRGYNEYTYTLAGESVELTLTWDCDLSNVQINLLDPRTRFPELLYNVNNSIDQNNNNWECGNKVWVLPTDKLVYIRLLSQFDEYLSDAGSPETYKNGGGEFEIKFEAILPEEGD